MSVLYTHIAQKAPAASGLGDQTIYYARPVARGVIDTQKMAWHLEKATTLSTADIQAALYGLEDMMVYYLSDGYIMRFDGVGSFRIGVSSRGVSSPDLVVPAHFRDPRILYTPAKEQKKMLRTLKFERV